MHEKKTAEVSQDGESEINRALRREVRKLSKAVSKLELEDKRQREEKRKCKKVTVQDRKECQKPLENRDLELW